MKQYRITLEGHTFDVKVLDDPRQQQVHVEVDGETFTIGVESRSAVTEVTLEEDTSIPSPATTRDLGKATTAGNAVAAPLPGVIKSIEVRPGQQVAPNDELIVIEAMKMDNVIRATRAGTIGTIHVTAGRQVVYGETLLDFAD
jgi:biotin carboxyl carrier protein